MGQIENAIRAIATNDSLTQEEKEAQKRAAKRQGWLDAKLNQIDNLLPHTFDWGNGETLEVKTFAVSETPQGTPIVTAQCAYRVNGQLVEDGEMKIVNPPVLVPDDATPDVTRTDANGRQYNYREDVVEALSEVAKKRFRK